MSNFSLISKISQTMLLITKSLKMIPQDKQHIMYTRVGKVLQKYNIKPQQFNNNDNYANNQNIGLSQLQEASFLKDLEFNMNFIKLSYPNLNFNIDQMTEPQSPQDRETKQDEKVGDKNKKPLQGIKLELENEKQILSQMKSMPSVRQQVQFSNWSEGNIDPQKLKRHKEMLQRQFFGGDHWKNKQKPKNSAQVLLQTFMANPPIQPPIVTQQMLKNNDKNKFQDDPIQRFKKIKR